METNKQWKRVPFDIELAKKIQVGEIEGRIVTREGNAVRIVCWDVLDKNFPIIALCKNINGKNEIVLNCTKDGFVNIDKLEDELDIVIELLEEAPKHEFKPFDKVLVRNGNNKWKPAFYGYRIDNRYSYVTSGDFKYEQCIPYEGNEHLVGTTDKPE